MNIKHKILSAFFLIFMLLPLPFLHTACEKKQEVPQELSFFAMDTYMTLKAYKGDLSEEETTAALSEAKEEILRIEKLFSVTDPNSEISALNKGETLTSPSADLISLLNYADELYKNTDGMYDITVYPLLISWGFTTSNGPSVPTSEAIEKALAEIDASRITVTRDESGAYTVSAGGAMLDLGSIAKGYAGSRAAELLKAKGVSSAILILGGNVQTLGKKPSGKGYTVGIADPNAPDRSLSTVSTDDLDRIFKNTDGNAPESYAVVTSGTYQRNFTENGKTYHHLMDVSTGFPAENGLVSVTVICPDGAMADGLSTSLFLLGYDRAMEYYRTHGGFEAVFIDKNGNIIKTDGLAEGSR